MSTNALGERDSIQAILLGRLLGALVILFMLFDGANRIMPWPAVTEAMDRIGYGSSDALARALGIVSVACSAFATIPPTSILGAILWTGYLGDVMAAHLNIF
jgi:DoxX-like protein